MSRRVRRSGFLVLLLALIGLALSVPPSFAAECGTWNDVHPVRWGDGRAYCASSGGSCTECTAVYGGGGTTCVQDSFGDSFCYDYQDW